MLHVTCYLLCISPPHERRQHKVAIELDEARNHLYYFVQGERFLSTERKDFLDNKPVNRGNRIAYTPNSVVRTSLFRKAIPAVIAAINNYGQNYFTPYFDHVLHCAPSTHTLYRKCHLATLQPIIADSLDKNILTFDSSID